MSEVVTDKSGRRIQLRRIGVLEQLRLFKALGPQLSEISAYVGLSKIAAAVTMIDDIPVPFPVNEVGVEAILERLGDDGVAAVGATMMPRTRDAVVTEAGN
jgi:hypothetical protein